MIQQAHGIGRSRMRGLSGTPVKSRVLLLKTPCLEATHGFCDSWGYRSLKLLFFGNHHEPDSSLNPPETRLLDYLEDHGT